MRYPQDPTSLYTSVRCIGTSSIRQTPQPDLKSNAHTSCTYAKYIIDYNSIYIYYYIYIYNCSNPRKIEHLENWTLWAKHHRSTWIFFHPGISWDGPLRDIGVSSPWTKLVGPRLWKKGDSNWMPSATTPWSAASPLHIFGKKPCMFLNDLRTGTWQLGPILWMESCHENLKAEIV